MLHAVIRGKNMMDKQWQPDAKKETSPIRELPKNSVSGVGMEENLTDKLEQLHAEFDEHNSVKKSPKRFFVRLADYFVPSRCRDDDLTLLRARVFVNLSLVYSIITLSCLFWVWFAIPLALEYQWLSSGLIIPLFVYYTLAPWLLKATEHYYLLANIAVFLAIAVVGSAVALGGGPQVSPVNYLFLIPAFMAIVLVEFKHALIWVAGVLSVAMGMYYLHFTDFQYPLLFDHDYMLHIEVISWLVGFSGAIGAALLYESMMQRLRQKLEDRHDAMQLLATHDPLTKLPNRTLFADRLNSAISHGQRTGQPFALLYIDLDGFKPVNDTYGHKQGDWALVEVAKRLTARMRKVDTVARLGGDEFAILIANIENRDALIQLLDDIIASINEPFVLDENLTASLSASVGVVIYPEDGESAQVLQTRADDAMYRAKKKKSTYRFHSQ